MSCYSGRQVCSSVCVCRVEALQGGVRGEGGALVGGGGGEEEGDDVRSCRLKIVEWQLWIGWEQNEEEEG